MIGAPPKVFTIPAGNAFVDCLARGLMQQSGADPLALSQTLLLLPNRRAARALGEAFLRLGEGRPQLLPTMVPLGDIDAEELLLEAGGSLGAAQDLALAPAIGDTHRTALLAQLVAGWLTSSGTSLPAAGVIRLARDLARLIDEADTAEIDWAKLDEIVPQALAAHWQTTRDFLKIVTEHWPAIVSSQGHLGPAARRRLLLDAQAALWAERPPQHPVVAAGSTGSIPAVGRLLARVAQLPQGQVVLPGLDQACSSDLWEAIAADPSHPQQGLARLLERLGTAPKEVAVWPDALPESGIASLTNLALRPALQTQSWRDLASGASERQHRSWQRALEGITWYDCADPRQEACLIALLLRRALETKGKTAALVTPDRALARRVAAELQRWGIEIDDSGGRPLLQTPPLVFLRLLAKCLAEDLAPEALLALLKHPFARAGRTRAELSRISRELERHLLRGPRPPAGLDGLRRALQRRLRAYPPLPKGLAERIEALFDSLEACLAPLDSASKQPTAAFPALFDALLQAAEALADGEGRAGAARLWAEETGEAAAEALSEIRAAAASLPDLAPGDLAGMIESLLEGRVLRPRYGLHPRLFLWGPLEARLQGADLLILGGLNEGTWPRPADPGPWLSRPMREALELPPPERRIGQSAHDLLQALAAPEVILTRALKQEGTPTIPARWLSRLEALTKVLGIETALKRPAVEAAAWVAELDRPERVEPCRPPTPRPPLEARPRQLSVTRIETWMRNPYAIFAGSILGLQKLDEIAEDPGPAERGQLIHAVLEAFVQAYPKALPADPEPALNRIVESSLADSGLDPSLQQLWQPRMTRLLAWFLEMEEQRRDDCQEVLAEVNGALALEGAQFRLTAKADRLELRSDGKIVLIDYKTGTLPRQREVNLGLAPQLPLEGAIARAGGFSSLPGAPLQDLELWRLVGGADSGEFKTISGGRNPDAETLAEKALEGLTALVAAFDQVETAYLAHPRPGAIPRFDDYRQLARVDEWSSDAGEVG
ncbi:MAG: double-strand break repair protein AddB [Kiloniellales bacterium]